MTKEIIIDGVNVAGCGYYDAKNDKGDWCDLTCTQEHAPFFRCESMPQCYYKQLQRLKQENEELKESYQKLYENAEQLTDKYNKYDGKKQNELVEIINKATDIKNKYKQALEEIRKYCEEQNLKADYTACEVLTIIDEVLNEN